MSQSYLHLCNVAESTKKTENSPIAETNVNVSYDDDNVNFANIQ